MKMAKKGTTNVTTLSALIMGVQGLKTVIQNHGEEIEMIFMSKITLVVDLSINRF